MGVAPGCPGLAPEERPLGRVRPSRQVR
jgi:hypothetical protein